MENKLYFDHDILPIHEIHLCHIEEPNIIVDYYERIIGAETDEYLEFVVTYHADNQQFYLTVFNKDEISGETNMTYLINSEVMIRLNEICKKYEIVHWHSRDDLTSADGIMIVFKYQYLGEKIRLTSDEMIESGLDFFYAVKSILSEVANHSWRMTEKESK